MHLSGLAENSCRFMNAPRTLAGITRLTFQEIHSLSSCKYRNKAGPDFAAFHLFVSDHLH